VVAGLRLRQFHVEQRLRIVDGEVTGEGDGFHGFDSVGMRWVAFTVGGLRSANGPFQQEPVYDLQSFLLP